MMLHDQVNRERLRSLAEDRLKLPVVTLGDERDCELARGALALLDVLNIAVRRAAFLNDCNGELHDRLTRAQQRAAEYQEAAENYERLYAEALRRLNA